MKLIKNKYIPRHTKPFIAFHWINAISFMLLFFSGLPLLCEGFGWIYDYLGAENVQTFHHIMGVIFFINPYLGLVFAWKGYRRMISEVATFSKRDLTFAAKFGPELIGMEVHGLAPQGFYNGGEKINIALQMIACGILAFSGMALWGSDYFSSDLKPWLIAFHSICATIAFAASLGHIYLAVVVSPGSVKGMVDGSVDIKYAKDHHSRWLAELVNNGEISRKELSDAPAKYR